MTMAADKKTMFLGYQLLGDGHMVQFATKVNQIRHVPKNKEGQNQLDLCVSGQGIRQLCRRMGTAGTEFKILILIGTNDLINYTPVKRFRICLYDIIRKHRGKDIVICTIPLPALYHNDTKRRELWQGYNTAIRKLKFARVLDLSDIFVDQDNLFCKTYPCPPGDKILPKIDLIHFNSHGIEVIRQFLVKNLSAETAL